METYRLCIINPGSTSTKISVFENEKEVATDSVFHDAPLLLSFENVNDQAPMRKKVVLDFLAANGYRPEDIDYFVGRAGGAHPQHSGVMPIDEVLVEDTKNTVGGSDHAAKLGVLVAYELGQTYGKPAFTLDPTNIDEMIDVARLTGIKGVYRRSQLHAINHRAIAMIHAKKIGKKYKDCRFIVAHIDGGITVAAHCNGRVIDTTEGAGAEGAFTPTRLGSIPVLEVIKYLEAGHTTEEIRKMCSRAGGFVSHFGTADSDKVRQMIADGDEHAKIVWDAMIYQIAKAIGEMSTVMYGDVDAILLTGGLMRFDDITEELTKRCGFIAPIFVYPGEAEQEAMAHSVLRVLTGEDEAHPYTGKPIWDGFDWDH